MLYISQCVLQQALNAHTHTHTHTHTHARINTNTCTDFLLVCNMTCCGQVTCSYALTQGRWQESFKARYAIYIQICYMHTGMQLATEMLYACWSKKMIFQARQMVGSGKLLELLALYNFHAKILFAKWYILIHGLFISLMSEYRYKIISCLPISMFHHYC